ASQRALGTHFRSHPVQSNIARLERVLPQDQEQDSEDSEDSEDDQVDQDLQEELRLWQQDFFNVLSNIGDFNQQRFDGIVSSFIKWLYEANARLAIPQHPAVRMFHLRKQNKNTDNSATYKRSSNPQRTNARTRQKRRDKYLFELAQHKYYNRRKDVVNMIMEDEDRQECKVPLQDLEDKFKNIYERSNDRILEEYKMKIPSEDIQVSLDDVEQELCSIKLDSAPGADKVYVRTIRDLKIAGIIKIIIDIMLVTGYVPMSFHEGRTVMIPKS